jgi:flagellar motor switch protein FliN
MSDQMNQNQIDSLLSDASLSGSGSEPLSEDASAEAGPKNYEALTAAYEVFTAQAVTVLSTLLNKTIRFQIVQCSAADAAALKGVGGSLLAVELPFSVEGSGNCEIIIDKKEVAALSDLMMMGDGKAEYTEDHRDAIGELFNQVLGAFASTLTTKHSIPASIGPVVVKDCDPASPPFSLDQFDMGLLKISVSDLGDSQLAVLFSTTVADVLISKLSGGGAEEAMPEGDAGSASTGLNSSELSDLSEVTAFGNSPSSANGSSFTETSLASTSTGASSAAHENVEMLMDISLDVSIELGRSLMSIKRVLELAPGSVIELDRMAGEPVDLLVNDKVVAKGEVVVVDENFGIRIVSLVSPEERIRSLK